MKCEHERSTILDRFNHILNLTSLPSFQQRSGNETMLYMSLHFIIIASQNLSHLKMFPDQKQFCHLNKFPLPFFSPSFSLSISHSLFFISTTMPPEKKNKLFDFQRVFCGSNASCHELRFAVIIIAFPLLVVCFVHVHKT